MRRFGFLLVLIVIFLAGCGDTLSEEEAENALRAVFEGDTAAANSYFCPSDQLPDDLAILPAEVVFKEVDCATKGADTVECDLTLSENEQEREIFLVFKVEDGLLCEAEVK